MKRWLLAMSLSMACLSTAPAEDTEPTPAEKAPAKPADAKPAPAKR